MSTSSYSTSRFYSSMASSSSSTSSTSSASSTKSSPSMPINIGFTPGGTDALLDIFPSRSSSISSQASACAFPSWPKSGVSLHSPPERGHGSSYISDEDLFGLDTDDLDGSLPYLSEAPAPPRQAHEYGFWADQMTTKPTAPVVLPPLSIRPKTVRRSPVKKTSTLRRTPKGLPSIRESTM